MVRHGAGGRQAGPAAHQQDAAHDRREAMTNFGAHERYLQGLAEMPDREGPPDQAAVAQGTSLQPGQKPRADSRVAFSEAEGARGSQPPVVQYCCILAMAWSLLIAATSASLR